MRGPRGSAGVPVRRLRARRLCCLRRACRASAASWSRRAPASISPSIGVGLEFFAIAVVALGAGGLPSGRVKIGETLVGALILMMVFNYMTIRGVPGTWQTTATGLLLLAADGRRPAGAGRRARRRRSASRLSATTLPADGRGARLGRNAIVARRPLVLAVVFAVINPRFATLANLVTLIEQNAALAIVAVGAMLGIVSRSSTSRRARSWRSARSWPRSRSRPASPRAARAARRHPRLPRRLCAQRRSSSAASASIR